MNVNNKSRSENVIKNMGVGVFFQVISLILGFVSRTIFIKILGVEYLGLNSLFTNILTILYHDKLAISRYFTIFYVKKDLANFARSKIHLIRRYVQSKK